MSGRGFRLYPGKEDCILIDMVDVSRKHGLQAAPVLYGLPPGIKAQGEKLEDMALTIAELQEKYPAMDVAQQCADAGKPMSLADLKARALTFSVWDLQPLPTDWAECALTWIKCGEQFRVSYPFSDGHETLTVQQDLIGKWEVFCTLRPTQHKKKGGAQLLPSRERTLTSGLETSVAAATVAESFVREHRPDVIKLARADAPWREHAASEGQLRFLQKLGVPFAKAISKGEASDLITFAKSRGRAR